MKRIVEEKKDLAIELAKYDRKEQKQILKAARHLQDYMALTLDELTEDEVLDEEIKELEKENK